MRADRLVSIMLLLQNKPKMTTRELADRLEVSPRTILRDMDALSAAGIPVVSVRGKAGGWKFIDHFRHRLSGMKMSDIKSLFILPSEKVLADLGIRTEGMDIRQKLLASLPEYTKNEAHPFMEKILIDTDTWKPARKYPKTMQTVQQALWEDRKLRLRYEKADGSGSERVVSPLGLVAKGSAWYLVAMTEEGELRSFRVSRMVHAEVETESFTRPESFSLADYWKQSKAEFVRNLPEYEVHVLAHSSILNRMTFTDRFVRRVHAGETAESAAAEGPVPKEWTPVTLSFPNEQEAIGYLLGYGERIKLRRPAHLIEKIVRRAEAVIDLYTRS